MERDERDLAFAGGGLDRAAHLRRDLAALMADPATLALPFWRGKPLLADTAEGGRRLGLLAPDHPVLAGGGAPLLLGLADGAARLAVDISGWEPVGEVAMPGSFFDPTEQRHPDLPDDHRFAELRGVMLALDPLEAELAATARSLLAWHGTHAFCSACGAASEVAQAGWQRNCPACGAHHFPRTDPVVIMLVTRGNRTLIGRSPGWPEGMYSCLAGFMEPGETLEAAVRREVAEETGVEVGPVRFIASQPWPFPSSLMLGCQGEALTEEMVLDPVEIEDAMWLTREDLAAVFAGTHPVVRPPRQGAIAGHLLRMWLADRLN